MFEITRHTFHWVDILISIPYIVIFIVISFFVRRKYLEEKPEYRYFTKGLIIKMLGAITFASIYIFYYGDGDTMYYFRGAKTLSQIFIEDPTEYFRLMLSSTDFRPDLMYIRSRVPYAKSPEEWAAVRMVSLYTLLGMNRFWVVTILTSVISFYGNWKMYQSFLLFFPKRIKAAFWSVFFIPNVIIWGSGILKDSFGFAFLGVFLYAFIKLFFKYNFKPKYIVALVLSALVIINIKVYILIAFLPSLLLGWFVYNRQQIKNNLLRELITPIILSIGALIGMLFVSNLMANSSKYQMEKLQSRAEGFHSWHTVVGGASYSLGKVDYTPLGLIEKIPAALGATYFRPDVTEITNASTALGATESLVVLILFILMLFRQKLFWIKESFNHPFLIMAVSFSLIFGFIVGFTSYNFGALARYKIPVMPFFVFILLHFNALYLEKKKSKREAVD